MLGTGGGGHTYEAELITLQALETFGPVPLVPVDALPAEGILMPLGHIGAPTVSLEKLDSGDEAPRIRERVEAELGRPVVAVMASEIGGANGVLPVAYASRLGLPLVDADAMGRAFPEVQMVSHARRGPPPRPHRPVRRGAAASCRSGRAAASGRSGSRATSPSRSAAPR